MGKKANIVVHPANMFAIPLIRHFEDSDFDFEHSFGVLFRLECHISEILEIFYLQNSTIIIIEKLRNNN